MDDESVRNLRNQIGGGINMKVYCVGYTRKDFLTTFHNLPFEYTYILNELQLERMSEGEKQDSFVWKTHAKNMYSCTWVHSFWNQSVDKRRIPLLVSFVMDKEVAEKILKEPECLRSLRKTLAKITYDEVLEFSNKEVRDTWEDDDVVFEEKTTVNEENVTKIVKGVVKVVCEKENKLPCCFIDASVDDFLDALHRIPLEFRMEISFSFPYSGNGTCVNNFNIVTNEVLEQERKNGYDGWPVCKRIFLNEPVSLLPKERRIYNEMNNLYNEFEGFPFHGKSSKEMLEKLLLLSYLREFEEDASSESRKFLSSHSDEKELIEALCTYLKKPISNTLLDVLKTTEDTVSKTRKVKKNRSKKKKKRCNISNFRYKRFFTTVVLWNLLILITFFFFDAYLYTNENCIHITFFFEMKNLVAYLLAILQGIVTTLLFMRKRRKEV